MNKILFWNVDTQNDFMLKGGKLYVEGAETIIPNLKKLTEFAKDYRLRVVNTFDWHTPASKEISDNPDFKTTFPSHCLAHTRGAYSIKEAAVENAFIVEHGNQNEDIMLHQLDKYRNVAVLKDAFDVFEGNPLTDKLLKLLNPELTVVYGVATNVCVNYAVLGLVRRGRRVTDFYLMNILNVI